MPAQRLLEREHLDTAIEQGRAARLVGREVYHPAAQGGRGVVVKRPAGFMIRAVVKCARSGCARRRVVYFASGCHHGAFCYAKDPNTGAYLGDFRNVEYRCAKHGGR